MDTITNSNLASNPLRLVHEYMASLAIEPDYAIAYLRRNLEGMKAEEIRQWFDYLSELLVEEGCTADIWITMASLCAVPKSKH